MGNHQTTTAGNAENHCESHQGHHGRGSISKTMSRGKNFMRLGRKRLSGTWDTSASKLSNDSHSVHCVENEFSSIFPSAEAMERHGMASADVCRDVAGLDGESILVQNV